MYFIPPQFTDNLLKLIGNEVLTFTTLWANSVDKIGDIFLIFPRKQVLKFHADELKNVTKPVFCEKYFNMSSAENFSQSAKCFKMPSTAAADSILICFVFFVVFCVCVCVCVCVCFQTN